MAGARGRKLDTSGLAQLGGAANATLGQIGEMNYRGGAALGAAIGEGGVRLGASIAAGRENKREEARYQEQKGIEKGRWEAAEKRAKTRDAMALLEILDKRRTALQEEGAGLGVLAGMSPEEGERLGVSPDDAQTAMAQHQERLGQLDARYNAVLAQIDPTLVEETFGAPPPAVTVRDPATGQTRSVPVDDARLRLLAAETFLAGRSKRRGRSDGLAGLAQEVLEERARRKAEADRLLITQQLRGSILKGLMSQFAGGADEILGRQLSDDEAEDLAAMVQAGVEMLQPDPKTGMIGDEEIGRLRSYITNEWLGKIAERERAAAKGGEDEKEDPSAVQHGGLSYLRSRGLDITKYGPNIVNMAKQGYALKDVQAQVDKWVDDERSDKSLGLAQRSAEGMETRVGLAEDAAQRAIDEATRTREQMEKKEAERAEKESLDLVRPLLPKAAVLDPSKTKYNMETGKDDPVIKEPARENRLAEAPAEHLRAALASGKLLESEAVLVREALAAKGETEPAAAAPQGDKEKEAAAIREMPEGPAKKRAAQNYRERWYPRGK